MFDVTENLTFHPICLLFPDMQPDEFDELVENIREHGVIVPILVYDGQIVDGRHRWKACEKLDIRCPIRDWEPRDPNESLIDLVVSLNVGQRKLTDDQQGRIAVEIDSMMDARDAQAEEQIKRDKRDAEANRSQGSRAPQSHDKAQTLSDTVAQPH